jgi:DNA polymerase III sliding clamp (beta) subunit (PCNA family)
VKIVVDSKALKNAISWGTKGANRSLGADASGSTVTLSFEDSVLTLKSYDGSMNFFIAKVPVLRSEEDEPFAVRVFGPLLASVTTPLPNSGEVTLDVQENAVDVILPRSKFRVAQVKTNEPRFPDVPDSLGSVSLSDFKSVINHAANIAIPNPAVPVLGAVLLEFHPDKPQIRVEATDRQRMVIRDLAYSPQVDADESHVIVPSDSLKTLLANLPDAQDVDIHVSDSMFGVSGGDFSGFVGVLDVKPVAYAPLRELVVDKRILLEKNDLKTAISHVTSMSDAGERVILYLDPEGSMRLGNTSGTATVDVDVTLENINEKYQIVTDPRMILSTVSATNTPVISLSFVSEVKPIIVRETTVNGLDDTNYFTMFMPNRGDVR